MCISFALVPDAGNFKSFKAYGQKLHIFGFFPRYFSLKRLDNIVKDTTTCGSFLPGRDDDVVLISVVLISAIPY